MSQLLLVYSGAIVAILAAGLAIQYRRDKRINALNLPEVGMIADQALRRYRQQLGALLALSAICTLFVGCILVVATLVLGRLWPALQLFRMPIYKADFSYITVIILFIGGTRVANRLFALVFVQPISSDALFSTRLIMQRVARTTVPTLCLPLLFVLAIAYAPLALQSTLERSDIVLLGLWITAVVVVSLITPLDRWMLALLVREQSALAAHDANLATRALLRVEARAFGRTMFTLQAVGGLLIVPFWWVVWLLLRAALGGFDATKWFALVFAVLLSANIIVAPLVALGVTQFYEYVQARETKERS